MSICFVLLASCLSNNGVQQSNDLVDINEQLTELLAQADLASNRSEKPILGQFASKVHAKANELAQQQQTALAIGFYQAASQAYWRDDIAQNNSAIFEISNKVKELCAQLGDQAPDRDCFISPLMEHIASVDMITFNPELSIQGGEASEEMAARSRTLLLDLGKKSNDQVGFANGALTNLFNYAAENQSILSEHPELNTYICSNLVTVFDDYVLALFRLEDYYVNINRAAGNNDLVVIEDEHPLFKTYKQNANTANTLAVRAKNFVSGQVSSCT